MISIGELCGVRGPPECQKRPFLEKAEAEHAMRELLRIGKARDPARINVYRCSVCQRWHVGHRDRRFVETGAK